MHLEGRYRLDSAFCQRGGQSRVWRGFDTVFQKSCVIKSGPYVKDEAFLTLKLSHPYVAAPYDFCTPENSDSFAVYQEYRQRSLLEWNAFKKHQGNDRIRIAAQLSEFLSYLHHHGWLYNDFKPEHFLVNEFDLRVIDFGLCSPAGPETTQGTYSGTFPYIAPERLSGRPSDKRSDIFALGMLLLHAFYPDEEWDSVPSLPTQNTLRRKTSSLDPFWKRIISKMISAEPSQRPASAADVWKYFLEATSSNITPFFPYHCSNTLATEVFEKSGIFVIHSPSEILLDDSLNRIILHAWEKRMRTLHFDLSSHSIEKAVDGICKVILGESAVSFYSALQRLSESNLMENALIIFKIPPSLSEKQCSFMGYLLSHFRSVGGLRVALFVQKLEQSFLREDWRFHHIPLLKPSDIQKDKRLLFPDLNGATNVPSDAALNFALPEQVLLFLKNTLPPSAYAMWPAAARKQSSVPSVEDLEIQERRILLQIGLLGGSISHRCAGKLMKEPSLFRRLIARGILMGDRDVVTSAIPASTLVNRLRKSEMRNMASRILTLCSKELSPKNLYRLYRFAENRESAQAVALDSANSSSSRSKWLWRAVKLGAKISKKDLYRLIVYFLRRAEFARARKLITYARAQHRTYRLADLTLDYYHRRQQFTAAQKLARRVARIAERSRRRETARYFSVRAAGFLILQERYDEADEVLRSLKEEKSADRIRGLIHHFLGLELLYKGRIHEAVKECEIAAGLRHRFQTSSIMNLGVALLKAGKYELSEQCLNKAIRVFSERVDLDRLAHAYNNLGVVFKQKGQLKKAKEEYYRTIYLSKISNNKNLLAPALINLAITFELEGNIEEAIASHNEAIAISSREGFSSHLATALTNIGLLYAMKMEKKKAIASLSRAARIRKKIGHSLIGSYEYLGLAYFYMGYFRKAARHFASAATKAEESGYTPDLFRNRLYLGLALLQKREMAKVTEILRSCSACASATTFEAGIFHYLTAAFQLSLMEEHSDAIAHIHQAERIFRTGKSMFWLGKLFQLKAAYCTSKDQYEKALLYQEAAYNIFAAMGTKKEMFGCMKPEKNMNIPTNFVEVMASRLPYKILLMLKEILALQNPAEMIDKILQTALEFTDMERALLILNQGAVRIFRSAGIEESSVEEIQSISLSAMEYSLNTGSDFVSLDATSDPLLKDRPSIIANRILSVVCIPLKTHDQNIGVLYLDSKEGVEVLATTESALLQVFASIISLALKNALALDSSVAENRRLRQALNSGVQFPEILGTSPNFVSVLETVSQLLDNTLPVLITGETGTGKDLVARMLHFHSNRKSEPFVAVNCSAFSRELLESELFGHEKGSFTGAHARKRGLFEQAENGTLFLDEIGDMPLDMQARLLRVLQDGEFRRVGGTQTLKTNARIVLATNHDLISMVRDRLFREDLFYRIKGAQIKIPPLRERREDISLLATAFLKEAAESSQKEIKGITPDALQLLKEYDWPGNVRQLRLEIQRTVVMARDKWIHKRDLCDEIVQSSALAPTSTKATGTLREVEKNMIVERLLEYKTVVGAADSLGLTRHGLYSKMRRYNISGKLLRNQNKEVS